MPCKNFQTTACKGNPDYGPVSHCLTPRQHLEKVHGITGTSLAIPVSTDTDGTAELLHVSYELHYPSPEN